MNRFLTIYIKYVILAALIYMPVFGFLNQIPIVDWDEARVAMNAYEMHKDGDFIVTHFEGKPDMWNTKPPLLIWFQAIFMKLMGVNELAVRFPSALAAFFVCVALLIFFLRYIKNFWFGFTSILVLVTSFGFIDTHASRTGDYDSLLTLFHTLSGLFFFAFCETKKNKYLYLFFAFTTFAVLTKSAAGLLFLPAVIIYSIIRKQFIPLLMSKHFYIGLFSFFAIVIGYYLLREINNPGYIALVWKSEFAGRYLESIDNHKHEFWFYYNNLVNYKLTIWYLLIPCGSIIGLLSSDRRIKQITLFSLLMILTFFIIISTTQTKLPWYDVPLYPFLSILIAVFIHFVFEFLMNRKLNNLKIRYNITPFLFLFLIFITPYQKIFAKTYMPKAYGWNNRDFYEISYYLKDAICGKRDVNGQFVLYDGYKTHLLFYLKILNDKGVRIAFKNWEKLEKGDSVITYQNNVKQYIEEHYSFDVISREGNVVNYKINDRKH